MEQDAPTYAIPSLIGENQSCLDIIGQAVNQTLLNTGVMYVFFDNGQGLSLQEAGKMVSNILIGEKSLLTDYTYQSDMDQQTYNSVKLSRPDEETGHTQVFEARDSQSIERQGLLQLHQSVDSAAGDAQILAQATLSYYNRPMKTFKVSALGVVGLRAGQMAYMQVANVPELSGGGFVLLEKVTHTFENDLHTMEFETLTL